MSLSDISLASSAVTYTSVYTNSEPGRVFLGADEELSDGGSPRVIMYGYDGLPMMPIAPPSPDYIPGPKELQKPPAQQDEDEHEPIFIQPHDPDFVPEQEDPEEYEDDETEDGPVDYPVDRGDDGDDDDVDSSGDNADDEDEDEEDREEEEEHLAPTNSDVVIPTDELVAPPKGTEPVIPPPSADTATTGARITVRLQAAISLPPKAEVERLLAMPTPSPSPLTSLSPPSTGERLARCTAPAALPSPPLPPHLHMPPPIDHRDDIPETEMPPRKRLCLFTLGSRDTWIDPAETVPEIAPMTVGELVDLLMEDRIAHQETIQIMEDEAYAAREAWAHSIGLSRAFHYELLTHQEQVHSSHEDNRRNVQTARPCFYADFMKYQPLNFKGNKGVVGLARWIEKMESVFQISGCSIENQVKFATCTLLDAVLTWWNSQIRSLGPDAYSMTWEVLKKKMTDKYYPQGEIKKLEIELWNLKRKNGANPKGNGCFECRATRHFKRDCPKLKNKDEEKGIAPGWVYAVGNAKKRGNASGDPDSNVVTVENSET
nr:reverse transcriptase domain-containing protein [Tanacetum cinerariifolium]